MAGAHRLGWTKRKVRLNPLIERVAHTWGGLIAAYGRSATRASQLVVEGLENLPAGPVIWFSWHDTNMLSLALHARVARRPVHTFVPPGIMGAGARGWVEGAGFIWHLLPQEGTGNPLAAVRAMAHAVAGDCDIVVAVDGPHGPRQAVKPGAFWLARLTGRPMITVGFAARPAFRWPRWDRHLIPLRGARIAAVFSKPLYVAPGTRIDAAFLGDVEVLLRTVRRRAEGLLQSSFGSRLA